MFKKERGITLVALVITIVVLLILAGVSLSLVIGQNGIITKAQAAKTNYTAADAAEATYLTTTEQHLTNILANVGLN